MFGRLKGREDEVADVLPRWEHLEVLIEYHDNRMGNVHGNSACTPPMHSSSILVATVYTLSQLNDPKPRTMTGDVDGQENY